jgi:hypothetical protein
MRRRSAIFLAIFSPSYVVIFLLWLAAIGHALQQPTVAERSGRSDKPPDAGGGGAAPPNPATPESAPKSA